MTGASTGHPAFADRAGAVEAPVAILIAALGGQGGAVLVEWIGHAARATGLVVQATSTPGVSQRTGATTYYVELAPAPVDGGPVRTPGLMPVPGRVDVLVCAELLEAARMLERGMCTPARTTVIASTHRAYTTAEKMSGADGRVDAGRVAGAIRALARRAVLVDLEAIRAAHATVISAPLFGALVGSGAVPLSRAAAEAAIRAVGRGVEASLAAFAAAHAAAAAADGPPAVPAHPAGAAGVPVLPATVAGAAGAMLPETVARRLRELPEPVAGIARVGAARLVGYQDAAWAASYVDRVARIAKRDLPTAAIVARHLAHWMSYEDAIRVAAIKARRVRLARIRAEAAAAPGDVVRVREMFAPGIDEIAAVLPAPLGAWLERRAARPAGPRRGLSLETSAPTGALALRVVAGLSRWRRRSLRFGREQAAIEAWLAALERALGVAGGQRAAHELAALPALRRGYGATQQRGVAHYDRIFAAFAAQLDGDPAAAAEALAQARDAALAAPDPPTPPARPQPVRFVGARSR